MVPPLTGRREMNLIRFVQESQRENYDQWQYRQEHAFMSADTLRVALPEFTKLCNLVEVPCLWV